MNPTLRNILAVIAGILIGGTVNMLIINFSGSIIAPPEGVDTTTAEGLKEGIHLFEPKHFLMPFLAHALGTFVGAFIAALIAATHKMKFAIAIGCVFLLGGIGAVFMIPAPLWYNITDLVLAYTPMAWLAGRWALKLNR
tara:strand:- start:8096 stop:8512 length:417 start_codon:yes stop_codon:yes gene_type:complete